MTDTERKLRAQIAKEIKAKFGSLAPYAMVQKFVLKGPGND
ncbi:hypothetical protein Q8W25_17825 [Shimia thalassica]|nr:hypothetical protein [Shimia thalassica]MDP2495892.1 hypothetical protein [Shimia thalassica]